MRMLWRFAVVIAFLASVPASAVELTGRQAAGQYPGTATNDSANAGSIGEYQRAATVSGTTANGTATITLASPGVVTFANAFSTTYPQPVWFTTSGGLPTGLAINTVYWTIPSTVTGTTFQLATSVDNAIAGTAINTSVSQSGTHTLNPNAKVTTASLANVTGMQLTAGDWDLHGIMDWAPAATTVMTSLQCAVSATTGSQGTVTSGGVSHLPMYGTTADSTDVDVIQHCGPLRISVASTTTVYLVSFSRFATSTMNAGGALIARRVR